MRRSFLILLFSIGVMFLSGCGGAKPTPEVQDMFDQKATMYTQKNMHYNFGRWGLKEVDGTNYQSGILIPVNSKVQLEAINAKQLSFIYKGQKIILRNIPKYTGMSISELAKDYFAPKKVNLSKFTRLERKAIKNGNVVRGMRKKAVLISLGTPPVHRTPSIESDTWTYWKNKWATFRVNFRKGRVSSVVGR